MIKEIESYCINVIQQGIGDGNFLKPDLCSLVQIKRRKLKC